jgi:hypothetical protein
VLPNFIRISCRIPIKNRIFDTNWRFLKIAKNTNSSTILTRIIRKSGISDVSRKGIFLTGKDSSTHINSAVAGKCTVKNADISLFSQPQTAAVILGCVVGKGGVYHLQIRIALADSASRTSNSCFILNSFIVNKSGIFQNHLILKIAK